MNTQFTIDSMFMLTWPEQKHSCDSVDGFKTSFFNLVCERNIPTFPSQEEVTDWKKLQPLFERLVSPGVRWPQLRGPSIR